MPGIGFVKVVKGIITIGHIAPYFANLAPYIVVGKQARLVVKLRDLGLTVIEIEPYVIVHRSNLVAPCHIEFPPSVLHVGHILQRRRCAHHLGNFNSGSQHARCAAVKPIKRGSKTVLEGIEIEANIKRCHLLPREIAAHQAWRGDVSGLAFTI